MKNFRQHCPGIWRGSRPQSAQDVSSLKLLGIKTIINLQSEFLESAQVDAESDWARALDVVFNHLPMSMILPPSRNVLVSAFSRLMDAGKEGPVYIHCHDGVDRTGVTMLVYDAIVRHIDHKTAIKTLINDGFHTWRYWWWLPFIENTIIAETLLNLKTEAEIHAKVLAGIE